jgi:signal peptidase II
VPSRGTNKEFERSATRDPVTFRRSAHLRLSLDAADQDAFDVGYAPDSGWKADIPFSPSRAHLRKLPVWPFSIVWYKTGGGYVRPQDEELVLNSRLTTGTIALAAAFAMLCLDQLTKHWALLSLGAVGTTIKLAGPVDLKLLLNRSNAFGLIPDYGEFSRWALIALSLAAAIWLGFALRRSTSLMNALGFAFMSAGAFGNAIDRVRLGAVVDLFDASKLRFVWVFNVADVSIDVGVGLILLAALVPALARRKVERANE